MDARDDEAPTVIKNVEETENLPLQDSKDEDVCVENQMPSHLQEEEIMKKKYGGLLQKKPPLISKDNERAFFDSADWALGKKSKGPLEALRPKLEPSPHHQARSRSPCAPADEAGGDGNCDDLNHGLLDLEDEKLQDFEMESGGNEQRKFDLNV